MKINEKLFEWYKIHKRKLPWRNSKNPYFIWVSEIIFQQTKISQGLPYYQNFISLFPNVQALAQANLDDVMKLWQGLGYYSRAKNMHNAAKYIVSKYGSIFPNSYSEIRSLAGVGDYTAAAIASIAFNQAYAVVDGNVYRFYSRFFGIFSAIDTSLGKKEFAKLANNLLDKNFPGDYNQAVMEFGSLQCIPHKPNCNICVFNIECVAFLTGKIEELPVKIKKIKKRIRFFQYLQVSQGDFTFITQRKENDIWQNLFEFPLIESSELDFNNRSFHEVCRNFLGNIDFNLIKISKQYKHILTHQTIFVRFIKIEISDIHPSIPIHWIKIKKEEIYKYAVSSLLEKFLQNEKI